MARYLLTRSEGTLAHLLMAAAIVAVESGEEAINHRTLSMADYTGPREGEALSSWLNRVALCYHMEVSELLEHDLGHGQVDDLDTAPLLTLLAMLSQRSGIEPDRLRCMSFAGWVPWLLDSLDDQIPDALETYAFQLSVLLPGLRRKTRSITSWRA